MTPAWFGLGVVVCRSGVWGGRGVAGGRCCTGWGFVGEGGMLVPLLTTVAFCPCGAHASASADKPRIQYPQTMKVGWCSAVLMWEMDHGVRGRRITQCPLVWVSCWVLLLLLLLCVTVLGTWTRASPDGGASSISSVPHGDAWLLAGCNSNCPSAPTPCTYSGVTDKCAAHAKAMRPFRTVHGRHTGAGTGTGTRSWRWACAGAWTGT